MVIGCQKNWLGPQHGDWLPKNFGYDLNMVIGCQKKLARTSTW